jgi:hypothetical protein
VRAREAPIGAAYPSVAAIALQRAVWSPALIHIDDLITNDLVKQALLFVREVFAMWSLEHSDQRLNAIMSCDDQFVTVRFHLIRNGEQWLATELDGYEDGIFAISSRESDFLTFFSK